jgi:hypothetical protein
MNPKLTPERLSRRAIVYVRPLLSGYKLNRFN